MKHSSICVVVLASAVVLVTGCSSNGGNNAAESTSVTTSDVVTSTSTTTTTTTSPTTTSVKESGGSASAVSSTDTVAPLPSGKKLTAGDFSDKQGEWKDGNYNVADQSGITGFGVDLRSCTVPKDVGFTTGSSYDPAVLRFNLGKNYSKLKFKVGQRNESKGIDQTVLIRSTDNKKQFGEINRVGFDEVTEVELDVDGKNVVFLQFYLDEGVRNCGYEPVTAVVYDAVLE